MYYQNYEDYMRQVLGYPACDPRIYEPYNYRSDLTYEDTYSTRNQHTSSLSDEEIRSFYPDIYNLVYPMVCRVCDNNTEPLTRELIEKMTDEVYTAIEDNNTVINVRVDVPVHEHKAEVTKTNSANTTTRKENRRDIGRKLTPVSDAKPMKSTNNKTENAVNDVSNLKTNRETRQYNSNLRDLIKILLLFRLFGNRPGNPRPPRPPYPGGPGRPPFPGGPNRPPMRPGDRPPIIQPRDYTDYLN